MTVSRRLIAALAAILLAAVGGVLLMSYVGSADQRAIARLDPVQVLVVIEPVPEGTATEDLTSLVALQAVPASAVVAGAVSSLDEVAGKVAKTELTPGEQLLTHRFVEPETFVGSGAVEIPAGKHQVTIQLDRVRVLGGHLVAGDTVGVFVSPPDRAETHLVEHKVLVARVQGGVAPQAADDPAAQTAAAEVIMVTLVLDAPAAEKIVWAAERASVWLSLEDAEASESGTRIVTPENVFE